MGEKENACPDWCSFTELPHWHDEAAYFAQTGKLFDGYCAHGEPKNTRDPCPDDRPSNGR